MLFLVWLLLLGLDVIDRAAGYANKPMVRKDGRSGHQDAGKSRNK
jgi:hypothetical protein